MVLLKKALLRDVGTNSHLQHLQPRTQSWSLGPSPVMGTHVYAQPEGCGWLLLFQLQVQPPAKLHTRPETLTGQVTQAATDKVLPSTPTELIKHKADSQVPSSSTAGTDRRALVRAHTSLCIPQVPAEPLCPPKAPAHILGPPALPTGPLLAGWSCMGFAMNTPRHPCSGGDTHPNSSGKCQAQRL